MSIFFFFAERQSRENFIEVEDMANLFHEINTYHRNKITKRYYYLSDENVVSKDKLVLLIDTLTKLGSKIT